MEIIRDPFTVHLTRPTVLTIGSFDGIHRGHKYLISRVEQRAQVIGAASALVTLHPHPKIVLRPESAMQYLSTIEERLDLLAPLGLDYAVVFPFSIEASQIHARDFVQILIDHLNMKEIVCGADFALGYKREGNVEFLRKLGQEKGFGVTIVEPQKFDDTIMSSTRIRELIADGNMDAASVQLGRFPSARGRVVKGFQRGRQLGFPTANLAIAERRLIPANGIYAVRVKIDDTWFGGAANIGTRPTFDNGHRLVEVYVLDFNGDLYDQVIEVQFVKRLRPELKFDNIQALVDQMNRDVEETRRVLAELKHE
jgi:riboflavin kinase/FMN adenylyltransferase